MLSVVLGLVCPISRLDLDDVQAEVDDQVAGKGMAEIVEPQPGANHPQASGVGGQMHALRWMLRWLSGVPLRVENTQSPPALRIAPQAALAEHRRERAE